MTDEPGTDDTPKAGLLDHLMELRTRLLHGVFAWLLIFLVLAPFAETIFTMLAAPLMAVLPADSQMIATQVASPFMAPFKLSLVVALFLAMPYLLHQIWSFVAPGLYRSEQRVAISLLVSSVLLFYLGALFAYFVVFPLVFAFFFAQAPVGVTVMTDISQFLDFALTLLFAFGLAFEVPVATVLLVRTGVTTPAKLAKGRAYVVVGAFTLGMFLTPPDVISQTLLAIPMYLLYEVGIILSRILVPGHKEVEAQQEAAERR
jgi:sec-independent protein translocase protein TatC